MKGFTFGTSLTIGIAVIIATVGYFSFIPHPAQVTPKGGSSSPREVARWEQFSDSRAQYDIRYPAGWVVDQFEHGIAVHPTDAAEPLWGVWFEDSTDSNGSYDSYLSLGQGLQQVREQLGASATVRRTSTTVGGTPAVSVTAFRSSDPQQTQEFITIEHHNVRFRIWNGSGPHPSFAQFAASFTPHITGIVGILSAARGREDQTCEVDDDCGLSFVGTAGETINCLNVGRNSMSVATGTENHLGHSCTTCTNNACGLELPPRGWCQCTAGRCRRSDLERYGLTWMCDLKAQFTYQTYASIESAFARSCELQFSTYRIPVGVAHSAEQAMYRAHYASPALTSLEGRGLPQDSEGFYTGWGDNTFVRYRDAEDRYPRVGWYVTSLELPGSLRGNYYLSDDGYLYAFLDNHALSGCH